MGSCEPERKRTAINPNLSVAHTDPIISNCGPEDSNVSGHTRLRPLDSGFQVEGTFQFQHLMPRVG